MATLGPSESVVVVGGGQAGAWAVKTLRDEGFAGRLTLVSAEAHLPYERPPLSKAVLLGEAGATSTRLFSESVYRDLGVELVSSDPAVKIFRDERSVITEQGARLAYDRLILCTGGRPRCPPIPGIDNSGVYVLRTLDDAERLGKRLRQAKRIAVLGGGWIGLETAAAARALGIEVLLIESADRLCARTLPPLVSAVLERFHAASGVEIRLSTEVRDIAETGDGRLRCRLSDGSDVAVCAVVVGVGLLPNDELARDAGLETSRGIVVDQYCRTSDPFVYAAGDVAIGPLTVAGDFVRLESWQNAQDQAVAAARNALGLPTVYCPLPWFWSDQHGLMIQICGFPDQRSRCVIRGSLDQSFVAFFVEDDRVVAAIGCNAPREVRFAKRLIERRRSISGVDLSDPNVALAAL